LSGPTEAGPGGSGLLLLAVALGIVAAGTGYVVGGLGAALGGGAGALVAAGYAWSFLHSHLARSRGGGAFDSVLAGGAMTRLLVAGVVGYAMWTAGRPAVMAYLLSFGGCFALLAVPQVVRTTRQIRNPKAAPPAVAKPAVAKPGSEPV
jgi:hypothetical protein